MTSPFETAGFRTAPFTVKPQQPQQTQQKPATQAPASNPVNQKEDDTFVKQQRETLRAEIKDEVEKEFKENQKKQEKKMKKKPFGGINRMIAGVKKCGIAVQEYTVGFGKGCVSGAIAGGVGFGVTKIVQTLKAFDKLANNESAKIGGKLARTAGKALKSNKFALGIGAAGIVLGMGFQIWKASLNVNERNAKVEHRYEDESHMDS